MNDYGTGHYAGSKVVLKSRTAQKNFQHHPSRIIAKRMLRGLKIVYNILCINVLNLHIRIKMPIFVYEVKHFVLNMGKDMIIKMLQSQLEAANAANIQLSMTISNLNATVSELRATMKGMEQTISNLETLLKNRDDSLSKAKSQMRSLSKMVENKSESQKTAQAESKTEEEQKAEGERKAAERKARGNNGAKRDMHFEMKTVEKDVYPDGVTDGQKSAFDKVRDVTRYIMIPPQFIKEVLHIHTIKSEGSLISATAHSLRCRTPVLTDLSSPALRSCAISTPCLSNALSTTFPKTDSILTNRQRMAFSRKRQACLRTCTGQCGAP